MIVVKATYRGETRKFTFECNALPTYYDLQTQLCRVFPLLNFRNFYLSQLFFSPNASQGGHILIAREVHDLEGYSASTKPHQRYFVNALLKFSVIDKDSLPSDPQSSVQHCHHQAGRAIPGIQPSPSVCEAHSKGDTQLNPAFPVNFYPSTDIHGRPSSIERASSYGEPASPSMTFNPSGSIVESIGQMNSSIQDLRRHLDTLTVAALGHSTNTCSICKNAVGGLQYTCRHCETCVCSSCNTKSEYFCLVTAGNHLLELSVNGQRPGSSPLTFSSPVPPHGGPSPFTPSTVALGTPTVPATSSATPTNNLPTPPPPPVIHEGIRCDGCNNILEGTRHKCLDCPDYDMCSGCIVSGKLDDHDASHEWISLDKPTYVVIHKPLNTAQQPPQDETSSIHNATCDLCDSVIVGQRYKCTVCPDFDTCKTCFSIVTDQHPKHTFVRIDDPTAYIQCDRPRVRHPAFCDVCRKTVYGIRYKCMHPECPDFDLCENCEALPIPQHPSSHPFLKIRNSEAIVPILNHVSQMAPTVAVPQSGPSLMSSSARRPLGHTPFPRDKLPAPTHPGIVPAPLTDSCSTLPDKLPIQEGVLAIPLSAATFTVLPIPRGDEEKESHNQDEIDHAAHKASSSPVVDSEASVLSNSQSVEKQDQITNACRGGLDTPLDEACLVAKDPCPSNSSLPWDLCRGLNNLLRDETLGHGQLNFGEAAVPTCNTTSTVSEQKQPVIHNHSPIAHSYSPTLPPLDSFPPTPAVEGAATSSLFGDDNPKSPPTVHTLTEPQGEIGIERGQQALSASCVGNVTVPDGQVFAPGSTFVKCWKMLNDGTNEWPQNTEIAFVGGDSFKGEQTSKFLIGGIKPGEIRNVWTGELKAPEFAGQYVSYWCLKDGQDNAFGQPIWINIEVVEPLSRSPNDSLSSSSVVIMPGLETPVAPRDSPKSTSTGPSVVSEDDDTLSDHSFVSIGSSSDDEDAELWTDSRRHVPAAQTHAMDYVLLYDDNSSEEGDL